MRARRRISCRRAFSASRSVVTARSLERGGLPLPHRRQRPDRPRATPSRSTGGQHVELLAANDEAAGDDTHRIVAGGQALAEVASVLDALPERTRTIFVLRRIEGMRHKEIALRLGISVSAVEKHVVRAIEALAGQMEAWR